jgi:hypothetical protein
VAYNYNTKDIFFLSHVNMDRNEHEKLGENKVKLNRCYTRHRLGQW